MLFLEARPYEALFLAHQLAVSHPLVMKTSFQDYRKHFSLITLACYKYCITYPCHQQYSLKLTSHIFVFVQL